MYMSVLPVCMYVYHKYVPVRTRRGQIPWNRVVESCKSPCRCWEPNLGPLRGSKYSILELSFWVQKTYFLRDLEALI